MAVSPARFPDGEGEAWVWDLSQPTAFSACVGTRVRASGAPGKAPLVPEPQAHSRDLSSFVLRTRKTGPQAGLIPLVVSSNKSDVQPKHLEACGPQSENREKMRSGKARPRGDEAASANNPPPDDRPVRSGPRSEHAEPNTRGVGAKSLVIPPRTDPEGELGGEDLAFPTLLGRQWPIAERGAPGFRAAVG